jgi:excisionase family DNA binding protein
MSELLTTKETAEILNITVPTLLQWAKDHKIEYVRIGRHFRFRKSSIEKALTPHGTNESFN